MTVSREAEKLLTLSKEQVEMSAVQKIIEIDNPQISFPPDSVGLDKQNETLRIRTGESEEIWDLAKM